MKGRFSRMWTSVTRVQSMASGSTAFRSWTLFSLLALVSISAARLPGQTAPSNTLKKSAIESHFAAAQQAQHDKDYSTAEREYQSVLALAPDFAEVHLNLGLVYQLQDRLSEAMAEFRRALKIKPTLVGANFFLGVDYCKAGEGTQAIPYLRAALHLEPNRPDIWLWLATAQEISGQPQAEVETIQRALQLKPNDIDLLYLLGNAFERLGKLQAAHLQKVAPGSSRTEQLLAESYAASNEWPSAVVHFKNALAASPNNSGLHARLGEVLLRAGKVNAAIREFDEELQRDPNSLRALVRRGEAGLIQGNVLAALTDWEKAAGIDIEQTERILGLRETGFGDSALEQLPDSIQKKIQKLAGDLQDRNPPSAHLALAFLAEQNGNSLQATAESDLAASAAKKAIADRSCARGDLILALQREEFSRIAPCAGHLLSSRLSPELRIRAASALLEAGQAEAALKTLKALPLPDGVSAEAAYWLARCYEKLATTAYLRLYQADPESYRLHQLMGDLDEARLELGAELALNPRHPGALQDLGNTYLLEHQPDKALPYLEKALAADPGNPDIHRDLGTAFSELRDYRKAEEHFKIAVSADRDGSVHYKLARVYQALGEKEKATREFALSTARNRESHDKLEKQTERLGEVTKFAEDP